MTTQLPEETKKTVVTPALYNALVASAQLRDIRLVKSQFYLEPDGLGDPQNWQHTHSCEIETSHFDADKKLIWTWVTAEAACLYEKKRVVSAECRYLIVYKVDGEPEDLEVAAFAKRVARFAAYPYFRAHFAQLASQAGLELPPLPVIKEKRLLPKTEKPPGWDEAVKSLPKEKTA